MCMCISYSCFAILLVVSVKCQHMYGGEVCATYFFWVYTMSSNSPFTIVVVLESLGHVSIETAGGV